MRRSLALTAFLLLASCGSGDRQSGGGESDSGAESLSVQDVSEPPPPASPSIRSEREAQSSGPNVAVTAAPGVAFNYRYAVRLEADRIAPVMEQHAAFCERQGLAVCRIVGMHYERHGDGDVTARLSVKLAPHVARQYGQRGVQAVLSAQGMLVEAEISGTDVAPRIDSATRSIAEISAEIERIEVQLRRPGLRPGDRAAFEYQLQQLRASQRANNDTREEAQASLAQTPLTFQYGSGNRIAGYGDEGLTIGEAWSQAKDNFLNVLAGILVVLVTLLPFALFGLAGWALFVWGRRVWRRTTARSDVAATRAASPDA